MKRLNHFIRPTTSTYQPDVIIGVDAEGSYDKDDKSTVRECKLENWTICFALKAGSHGWYTEKLIQGTTKLEFWTKIRRLIKDQGLCWLIAYNTVHVMSLLGFWERLSDRRWTICDVKETGEEEEKTEAQSKFDGYIVADDPPFIAVVKPVGGSGILKMVDMRNYGVTRGCLVTPNFTLAEECCDFLVSICKLLEREQLGALQATGASQAMHCYRRNFLDSAILVHNEYAALSLERQCLYSGRNECFKLGVCRGRIFHLDFNSFYPSIAVDASIPCRLTGHGESDVDKITDLRKRGFCVIADVMISTPAPFFPYRHNGTTIYPTGVFRTQLCGPELDLALACNSVLRVLYAAHYEPDCIFASWATYVHGMRIACEANEQWAEAALYKCMNNALYGKFAQQKRGWQNRPEVTALFDYGQWWGVPPLTDQERDDLTTGADQAFPPPPKYKEEYVRWRAIGWSTQVETVPEESFNSCPAVTAWLYSLARIKLMTAIGLAGWENVYYCDTDSVWCNEEGMARLAANNMVDQQEIGKLKIVGDFTEVTFHGLKHYETPTKSVHAGVPDHAQPIGPRAYEYRSSERLASALQLGRAPKAISVEKRVAFTPSYRHGKIDSYGNVTPWQIYKGVTPDD